MKNLATILAISSISISAAAHEIFPPETARAPAQYIESTSTDDGLQPVVGEMASSSGLPFGEEFRIAAFLVLLQIGIASTASDVMKARSHRRRR